MALDDVGQESLQVELHVIAPGLGAQDEEPGQVTAHLRRWSVQLLLLLLLLTHRSVMCNMTHRSVMCNMTQLSHVLQHTGQSCVTAHTGQSCVTAHTGKSCVT